MKGLDILHKQITHVIVLLIELIKVGLKNNNIDTDK